MGNKFDVILHLNEEEYEDEDDDLETPTPSDMQQIIPDEKKKQSCASFWRQYRLLIITLILALLLATLVPYGILRVVKTKVVPAQWSCSVDAQRRIPCTNGGINATANQCVAVGCCWDDRKVQVNGSTAPKCFHSFPSQFDYRVTSITGAQNLTFELSPWNSGLKSFHESSVSLQLTVDRVSDSYAKIRAVPKGQKVAQASIWPDISNKDVTDDDTTYGVANSLEDDRFTLTIYRKELNTSVLTLTGGPLVLTNNYTEYTIYVPSTNIYGLGEADHKTLRHKMNFEQWQLFSRSQLNSKTGRHYYGVQPFYMCIEDNGLVHGVLLGLSQPTTISLQPGPSISVRTSGQLIEIHVFVGPTPRDVMRQYTEVIGRPAMPPYWALGYHTCRSNGNTTVATDVINQFQDSDIPHESDCADGLLLRSLSIVSKDSKVYKDVASVSTLLHDSNRKLILFQGPTASNDTLSSGTDIFIRNGTEPYVGTINRKYVVYPDFRNANATEWLNEQYLELKDRSTNIVYDGIFLLDNTPLDQSSKLTTPCPTNVYIPPVSQYMMNYYFNDNDTICLTALESDGKTPHYVHHNTYSNEHITSVVTSIRNTSLIEGVSERVMLASLSTFAGSGQYGGHWGGDIETSWEALNASLLQALEYGLYGIPFTGSSICGYRGSVADEDLCWKWMLMGALFPLAFTFYGPNEAPREPVFFNEAFQTMSRDVLRLRYSLLPYIYTLFHQANQTGEPVMRPLFYEFPHDNRTWNNAAQFMLGEYLLVSPSLNSRTGLLAYFPAGTWYEFQTQRPIQSENGIYYNLLASQHFPNIYVKAGSVIVAQTPNVTTVDSRLNPFSVWAALDPKLMNSTSAAHGQLYIDDGLTSEPNISVELGGNSTAVWWTTSSSAGEDIPGLNTEVGFISVTGLETEPLDGSLCIIEPVSECNLTFHFNENINHMMVDLSMLGISFTQDYLMTWDYTESYSL